MLLPDYHIHTHYCGHAFGDIENYIKIAISRGIKQICFTDHLYRYYLTRADRRRFWDWGMNLTRLEKYYDEITFFKQLYQDEIEINIGLELDYIEEAERKLKEIISLYEFDFLLGSIHCLPQIGLKHIINYSKGQSEKIYNYYFKTAVKAIKSGIFDSLAHPDAIWRYVDWPENKSKRTLQQIGELVDTAVKNGVSLEINANGFNFSQKTYLPGGDPFLVLLDEIKSQKASFTLGSDAHNPKEVARNFNEIESLLKTKKISGCRIYRERTPIELKI